MPSRDFFAWRPHPWHGLSAGPEPPALVHAYVELTPFDVVKYEIDKQTGYLRVDRPQRTSASPPALYGFIPRTLSGPRVGALMPEVGRGDGDPLDVCVFSERPIDRAEVIVAAHVIGGIPMVDAGSADDKIVAVLANDAVWANVRELHELPAAFLHRLTHYFATYKLTPDQADPPRVGQPYDRQHACAVVQAALEDYRDAFGPER